jgi:outer membrane protein assembly factor BamE (lipoprotein component of BamABCDE complex)
MFPSPIPRAFAIATLAATALLAACASGPPRGEEQFMRVQRGMTHDDVARLLGVPDEKMKFPLSQTEAWDYRSQDTWGYMVVFSATFAADGRVASTFTRRINDGGEHSGR